MSIQEHRLKIKEIIDETPQVKTFRCETPNSNKINFYPGQFFMVSIKGDEENLKRAYSIASSPLEKSYVDIGLNKVGIFSTKLFSTLPGDILIFKGPYGKFYFTDDMKNDLLLIAGGVGITPLISIIRYCTDKKLGNKIKLLYSVRTPEEIIYKNEFEKIKNENENFDYIVTITRPKPEHDWHGMTGHLNEDILKRNINSVNEHIYFICGSNDFAKAMITILEKLGAKKEQIKTDIWGE